MIKLGGIISRNAFVNEAESDKYTHIGYGMYKQKGKEKDKDAPTFKKDGEKYVPFEKGNAEKGGGTSAGKDKPKVNIFDKPKEKEPKPKQDAMSTVNSIASMTGLRTQAIAGWADENDVNLSKISSALKSKKLKPMDLMTAISGNPGNKYSQDIISTYSQLDKPKDTKEIPSIKLKDIMPKSDKETFSGKSDIHKLSKNVQHQISMKIDELDKLAREAKQKGTEAPNYNLCKITVAGTNLYCDNNLGIPRDEMPQFKGKPRPGSPASKMKLNDNGEVDTEPVFKEMLKKKGIKTAETTIPADALKATQSELVGTKVAGMVKALEKEPNNPGINAPIYVSRDGYVIDGHHRWAAVTSHSISKGKPTNMKVIVIDDDAKNIIPMANKFADEMGIESKKADANQETAPKDSTGDRAGYPETNKFTRTLAQKAGITPAKLGKEEYQKKMIQAAYSALIDSNFHSVARKLIATIENNPELEKEPDWSKGPKMSDPDFKKKNDEFLKNTAYNSEYAKADPTIDKFGRAISKKSGWDGQEALDAIAFDLKMNGYKNLASKIQSIVEGKTKKSTKLKEIINEERSLSAIAYDIQKDWKQVNYAAKPYLQAMYSLDRITDKYGYDSGRSIVSYFLSNAGQWKGDTAKRIKDELKKMLK